MPISTIPYEDLQYPDPILVKGIGHIRSPKLKELSPAGEYGWGTYSLFLYFLKAGIKQLRESLKIEIPEDAEIFDVITQNEDLRELYLEAFSFFMSEQVIYDEDHGCYLVVGVSQNENGEFSPEIVGSISKENFDTARSMILLRNYISLSSADVAVKHSSKASEDLWNRAQEWMAKLEPQKHDDTMDVGNLISKLCAIHPSINYLNVYDLTVFQFYDCFLQLSYLRSVAFTQDIVSNHGSKDFKYEDWLTPQKNYEKGD